MEGLGFDSEIIKSDVIESLDHINNELGNVYHIIESKGENKSLDRRTVRWIV